MCKNHSYASVIYVLLADLRKYAEVDMYFVSSIFLGLFQTEALVYTVAIVGRQHFYCQNTSFMYRLSGAVWV